MCSEVAAGERTGSAPHFMKISKPKINMKRFIIISMVASMVAVNKGQITSQIAGMQTALSNPTVCTQSATDWRRPVLSDISVECGTSYIGLAIQLCPVLYTGYNETLLIINQIFGNSNCKGTLDETVFPPVVRFRFPINMTHACGSKFVTISGPGTGVFADFSNIETVNISGSVTSLDPTQGKVTYNAELSYFYSCAYPLEYLINNTRIDVSASSIAVRDNNGSFISTLSIELYSDSQFKIPLTVPKEGLELRTVIWVMVRADNLTDQYSVLMDRCYASISPLPTNSTFFNLFVPCSQDPLTTIYLNGDGHRATFSFQAFRFLEQQNETVSTYYLHCITRLCEISTCESFKQCSSRRRRREIKSTELGDLTTLTSKIPIVTQNNNKETVPVQGPERSVGESKKGLEIAVGILAVAVAAVFVVAAVFYKRLKH
ncbi:zona pellucida-like domain-containing protein 1 [Boleophthalmus pectinirostris]|uniref:zona pellucida-like domain-containing protein 1 n=1 Tax=Boleophthalmus pectinirostris TaxID=150288 RepID=UPI00242F4FD3|nr:zona pellucida-like domain-containing protein 1 [Boleophthalmus pectinirostris]